MSHLSHVRILVTHHCGNTRREAFNHPCSFQDVLDCCDYSERVVDIFAHQIQSEQYGGNRSVSIEGIALDHLSATTYPETVSVQESCTHHAISHSFLYDDRKTDSTTTAAHSKHIMGFLKQQKIMSSKLGTLWKNTGGCAENYRRATYYFVFNVVTILLFYY